MAYSAIATPTVLTDPGLLFWAPLGSTLPTNTATGGVYTDTWPVAWIPLGMTDTGSDFTRNLTTAPIISAEAIDPIAYRTTARDASVMFMLMNYTATNMARAFNGAVTTVTGTAGTTSTQVDPPVPGSETRCMIGYESLDSTYRYVAFQVVNSGSIKVAFGKSPAHASIQWTGQLEKPTTTQPWREWFAGAARA